MRPRGFKILNRIMADHRSLVYPQSSPTKTNKQAFITEHMKPTPSELSTHTMPQCRVNTSPPKLALPHSSHLKQPVSFYAESKVPAPEQHPLRRTPSVCSAYVPTQNTPNHGAVGNCASTTWNFGPNAVTQTVVSHVLTSFHLCGGK